MDTDDAALMYQGWGDGMLYEQQVERKTVLIIADTINRTMGGKGAWKAIMKMWKLPGDDAKQTTDLIGLLKKHNELGLKNGVKKRNGKR